MRISISTIRTVAKRSLVISLAMAAVWVSLHAQTAWEIATPQSQQVDAARLETARKELERRGTQAFLVLRNGKLIYEWYAEGRAASRTHYSASMAKALVGGTSLMLAMSQGVISPDDLAAKYIPRWRTGPAKAKITVRHLATHSSGLQDANQDGVPHSELPGWMGRFWKREPDPFTIAIRETPVIFPPGSAYHYSNPGMAVLAYAVTESLKGTRHSDIRTLLAERVMKPLDIPDADWDIGYGRSYHVDGLSLYANWGGGSFTPRATARIGQWMMQRGNWKGRQLVPPEYVDAVLKDAGTPRPPRAANQPAPASGLGWWVNHDQVWTKLPADAFSGAGAQHQVVLVVPSLDLVVVRNGGDLIQPGEDLGFWGAIERFVFNPVAEALTDYVPGKGRTARRTVPPSPVFARMEFAPVEQIVRKAKGGDNWPNTWAADGALYAAYGDGNGFEPFVPEKLSMGLVRVTGGPENFEGTNIYPSDLDTKGDDRRGKKASGMLAIGDRLYLMARNAANAQIAWSDDKGKSWQWAPWQFTESFGHPAFVQFGKAYAGATDNFVYVVSQDSGSAYEAADRYVMARAPKGRLLEKDAWEYFAGATGANVTWSERVSDRKPIFTNPGRCYRSSISYHEPSGRFLWAQIQSTESPRFWGGFGVYDAPNPWGPWTEVFATEHWDVGPGENAHFPTKWMSADGATVYLLFSGDDAFSVRKATLRRR